MLHTSVKHKVFADAPAVDGSRPVPIQHGSVVNDSFRQWHDVVGRRSRTASCFFRSLGGFQAHNVDFPEAAQEHRAMQIWE